MTSLTKICTPQAKNFFQVRTRRLAMSFEPLTRSVTLTEPEKFLHKATRNLVVLAREFPISAKCESVKNHSKILKLLQFEKC